MHRRDFLLGALALTGCHDVAQMIADTEEPKPRHGMYFGHSNRAYYTPSNPPQAIWPGLVTSSEALVAAWPTVSGGETGYYFYRNGQKINTLVLPTTNIGGGAVAQPYIVDTGLNPSTTYTYTVTAVFPTGETAPSAPITMTTLAGPTSGAGSTPTVLPTPATDPATWIAATPANGALASVPAGNTLWLVNQSSNNSSAGNAPGTANSGGGITITGCGLQYALSNMNNNGGDVIVISAGLTIAGNFTLPTFTGTSGFTYIVSSQAPEYAGAGGTLPAYSYSTSVRYTQFTLTAAPSTLAQMTGTASGTTLTVASLASGTIANGQTLTGNNVPYGTTITGGSGSSWTLSGTTSTGATFTGSISGTTLTVSGVTGTINQGEVLTGTGVTGGTTIGAQQNGTQWNVYPSQTVGSTAMASNVVMTTGGATSATLTANFTGRTGYYPVRFTPSSGNLAETRQVLFTHNSSAISWNVPLLYGATTTIGAHIGNYVTPWDANDPELPSANASPSMATIQFGYGSSGAGITLNNGTAKVRFIGIRFAPTNTYTVIYYGIYESTGATPCDHIYVDRCVIGCDTSGWPASMGYIVHGVGSNANHALYHQTYFYGLVDGSGGNGKPGGQDSNCVGIAGGGPICVQNCYLEAQNESVITGGQPIYQTNMPHDMVRRYNYSHKPSQWQMNAVGWEAKNHLELKVCQRCADYGNIIQNCWSGVSSQGQWARGFVLGSRDQTAGWGPNNGLSTICNVTGVSGNTIYFSVSQGTTNPFFFYGYNNGYVAIMNAGGIPTQVLKISSMGGSSPTFTCVCATPVQGTWTSGGTIAPCGTLTEGPWNNITDHDVHDNMIYDTGGGYYNFGNGDCSVTGYTTRCRFANNQIFLNPGTDTTMSNNQQAWGIQLNGVTTELTIDHNTLIINAADYQHFANGTASYSSGIASTGGYAADRVTITNNILDGNYVINAGSQVDGVAGLDQMFTNSYYANNLSLIDTAAFLATPTNGNVVGTAYHGPVAYTSVGFSSWPGSTVAPLDPTYWNLTTGSYLTASLTGGPLGAIF